MAHPWIPIGIPAAVNFGLFAWLGYGTLFGGATQVRPELVDPMDGLGAAVLPEGYLDDRADWGELQVGERFEGQRVLGAAPNDLLEGMPSAPLAVAAGRPGVNLYRGDHRVFGPNLSGVGAHGVRGTGSLAIWFPRDQSRVGLRFVRASGGQAVVTLYARDGARLDRVVLTGIESRMYAIERFRGRWDVAGLTVENDDPANGLGVAEIRFEAVAPVLAMGTPLRVLVFPIPVPEANEGQSASDGIEAFLASSLEWSNPGLAAVVADQEAPGSAAEARAAASRENAGIFVTGHAVRGSDGVRASAALYAPGSFDRPVAVVEVTGRDRLAAAQGLARRLSIALAERKGRVVEAEAMEGLADPGGLRAVLEARDALRAGALGEASARVASVELTGTHHASIEYTKSQIAYLGRRTDEALAHARAAAELADSPGALMRTSAWLALVAGDADGAARGFRTLVDNQADADAWFGLVESLIAAPKLPDGARAGVLAAIAAGLRADRDHVGLIAHLVRFSVADREPEYIDFWTAKARRRAAGPRTAISLELDLLVAASRRDEAEIATLRSDPRLLDPTLRRSVARSVAIWAERPDVALALDDADRALLLRSMGRGEDTPAVLSCLPHRADGLGPPPTRVGAGPSCRRPSDAADAPAPVNGDPSDPSVFFEEAIRSEAAGDAAAARRALDRVRGPDPAVLPWLALRRVHLAVLAELEGDPVEATRHYQGAQALLAGGEGTAREIWAYARERVAWLSDPG